MKKLILYFSLLLCTLILTGCKADRIIIDTNYIELEIGEQYAISPSLERNKKNIEFTFESSLESVAYVNDEGVVFAISSGVSEITILYKKLETKLIVNVKTPTTYTVTFDEQGGSAVDPQTIEEGKAATKPADPTKAGYIFKGWLLNSAAYDFATPVTDNITLVASWEEETVQPTTYTVTFDVQGGSTVDPQKVEEGKAATKPADPTKAGYIFKGWLLNSAAYDFSTPVTGDITLVASWEEEQITTIRYTVTFDANGGANIQGSVTVVEGAPVTKPAVDPVKTGYEFKGWTLNGVAYDFATPVTGDITLVASWEEIPDETSPVISLKPNANLKYVIYIGESYDLLEDVIATDNVDGDLTSKIKINYGKFDDQTNGTYEITYYVEDESGNIGEYMRRVLVTTKKSSVMFVGHAGCYSGLENTEAAFIAAATVKNYDAMEADLRQTKDGVFVLEHDETFAGLTLASTNWADLKDVEYTATRGGISYTTKICTLDRYLEICKEYNKKAVIELKWSNGINNNDQSRMDELMQAIKNAGMLDNVIFLASQYKCLEWVRNNGYSDIPCQYLVNSIESETYFERCTTWGFDISFSISSTNTLTWIQKYQAAGIKVACYTFSQYTTANDLQKWLDLGVDCVTCDVLTRNDVNVPEVDNSEDYLYEYKVTFKDIDGNVIEEQFVKEGYDALSPTAPTIAGYTFKKWDKNLINIQEDMEVNPIYEETVYNLKYVSSIGSVTESSWSSKSEFIDEFYTDLFNFFKDNVNNISQLSLSGSTYTLKMSTATNATATWTSVEDLKALNIYVVEKTIGHFIYKPMTVTNSSDYTPEADEHYFLNSDKYRIKYQALNAYFLNVIDNNYTSYNRGYNPTSDGRVQIFFRFQQWQQGTNIPQFNTLPKKYVVEGSTVEPTMPNNPTTYTISTDTIVLQNPTCDGYTFLGWYLNDVLVTSIEKGTTGNLILTAKWQKNE